MKKQILLTILSLSFGFTFSQTIDKLDEKNGFKDLKLGDPISKWYRDLGDSVSLGPQEMKYVYKGYCCQEAFDTQIQTIQLIFAHKKLVAIYLYAKPFQDKRDANGEPAGVVDFKLSESMYKNLVSKFYTAFGEPKYDEPRRDSRNPYLYHTTAWEGKKVRLIVDWDGGPGFSAAKITVLDMDNQNRRIQSGF